MYTCTCVSPCANHWSERHGSKETRRLTFPERFSGGAIFITMTYSAKQMQNRRDACRRYRERRRAQGWKVVQFFLPPSIVTEVRQCIGRFADRSTAVHSLSTASPKTRHSTRQYWRPAKGRQEGTPAATR